MTSTKVRYMGTNPANRGFSFCKHTICRFCPKIKPSGRITSHSTGLEFDCMKKVSCRSSNVIYCVSCTRCGLQYVGQTLHRVKDRVSEYFTSIDIYDQTKTVGRHFSQPNHNGLFDMVISVIKKPPKVKRQLLSRTV